MLPASAMAVDGDDEEAHAAQLVPVCTERRLPSQQDSAFPCARRAKILIAAEAAALRNKTGRLSNQALEHCCSVSAV